MGPASGSIRLLTRWSRSGADRSWATLAARLRQGQRSRTTSCAARELHLPELRRAIKDFSALEAGLPSAPSTPPGQRRPAIATRPGVSVLRGMRRRLALERSLLHDDACLCIRGPSPRLDDRDSGSWLIVSDSRRWQPSSCCDSRSRSGGRPDARMGRSVLRRRAASDAPATAAPDSNLSRWWAMMFLRLRSRAQEGFRDRAEKLQFLDDTAVCRGRVAATIRFAFVRGRRRDAPPAFSVAVRAAGTWLWGAPGRGRYGERWRCCWHGTAAGDLRGQTAIIWRSLLRLKF